MPRESKQPSPEAAGQAVRDVIEALPEGVAVYGADERLVVFNRRYREGIWPDSGDVIAPGLRFETLVRSNLARGLVGAAQVNDEAGIEAAVAAALARHRTLPARCEMHLPCGRWIRLTKRRAANGWTVGLYADITEVKRRERALRDSEARLAQVIRGSHDGFWDRDLVTGKVWYSDRYKELLGYAGDQFPDTVDAFVDHLHPDDRARVKDALERHLYERAPYDVQFRLRTRWGAYRWFGARALARYDAGGRPVALSGSIRDITAVRDGERDLRSMALSVERVRDEAQRASRAKSEFLATMSHEIRTPMNGVLGMVDLLLATNLTAEQRRYAETARASGTVLLNLINDILDFSKMEAGKITLRMSEFSLPELMQGVADILRPQADAGGIGLRVCVAPELRAPVIGDPRRLEQILLNLGGNAVKFTDRGGVAIEVTAGDRDDGVVTACFRVVDTGIGIPAGQSAAIFNRFTQADSTIVRKYGGTGLGLAISKELVELMDGRIGVDSDPGKGSTFWFTVPLVLDTAKPAAARSGASDAGPPEARPLRILLADDNGVNQLYLATLLKKAGHAVDIVADGEAAVAAVRGRASYDVVLMDIHMPVMDGLEATRAIRSIPDGRCEVPIIALTADDMTGNRERYLNMGMNDYVSKPIDVAALTATLAAATNVRVELAEPAPDRGRGRRATPADAATAALGDLLDRLDGMADGRG